MTDGLGQAGRQAGRVSRVVIYFLPRRREEGSARTRFHFLFCGIDCDSVYIETPKFDVEGKNLACIRKTDKTRRMRRRRKRRSAAAA